MKPVVFHPEAQEELQEAESYYESQQAGLRDEFAVEVTATILRIQKMPHLGSNQYGGLARSRLVDRFDYKLILSRSCQRYIFSRFIIIAEGLDTGFGD